MVHSTIIGSIKGDLRKANKNLTTARRFGHSSFYNQGEAKLRHAQNDIHYVASHGPSVSRASALRHAIGFQGRKPHPPGCNCPFHGGHKSRRMQIRRRRY